MSGRGEQVREDGPGSRDEDVAPVRVGEPVYDRSGELLGRVRGLEDGGFFVSTRRGAERLSIEHARSGHDFGEAHLMWRCSTCGEMGRIDEGMPSRCPNCDAPTEDIMWWTED